MIKLQSLIFDSALTLNQVVTAPPLIYQAQDLLQATKYFTYDIGQVSTVPIMVKQSCKSIDVELLYILPFWTCACKNTIPPNQECCSTDCVVFGA